MRNKRFRWLLTASFCFLCVATSAGLRGGQANSDSSPEQEAHNQVGKFMQGPPGVMPGRYQTPADMKRALQTADTIFAAYCRTPLLSPPRGFELLHNVNADARSTPRGGPIPVSSGFILLSYGSAKRLPNGRFAVIGEGPVLGGFAMNVINCGNPSAERDLGRDEKSAFYILPEQTATVHGWPQFGRVVFMTKRTQPRWVPVTVERVLKVQIAAARKTQQDVNASSPQSAYAKWQSGHDERIRQYQKAHDEMAKVNKQQADQMLASMLDSEKQTDKMMVAMAQQGSDMSKMVSNNQAQTSKTLQDLETRMNSLSPAQRTAPAYIYQSADGAFAVGQVVPPGTPGGVAVVYPNPDFYDKSLPPWEAQSLCVDVSTGPRSRDDPLYPTIVKIWQSLDWDAFAQVLK